MLRRAPSSVVWWSVAILGAPLVAGGALGGCDDGEQSIMEDVSADDTDAAASDMPDGISPPVNAVDPCSVSGYYFTSGDCSVVRCRELTCECPDPLAPEDPERVTTQSLSACVPGVGCLATVDCNRICDPSLDLSRRACEARIAAAGALRCAGDEACPQGECRAELVGAVCVDGVGCAEDGHCSADARCLFPESSIDETTGQPTSLGECGSGLGGSRCFDDADCDYQLCTSGVCSDGQPGAGCESAVHCASGICRLADGATTGTCTSGELGAPCASDDHCGAELHCASGLCQDDAVGSLCAEDAQCASGICVESLCRAGVLGSRCADDGDCQQGVCSQGSCVTGGVGSPCSSDESCSSGLYCAYGRCYDGTRGSLCYDATQCATFTCGLGTCSDGEPGAPCDNPEECVSGRCADPAGVEPGECTTGEPGSVCISGSHCVSGSCNLGVCN